MDYEYINRFKWCAVKNKNIYYAMNQRIFMHHLVLPLKKGRIIDHRNHDGLDNRYFNLRRCTHAENMQNSRVSKNNKLGLKGVTEIFTYDYKTKEVCLKFTAQITMDRKTIQLGYHDCPLMAKLAYNKAAVKYFGEFACFG